MSIVSYFGLPMDLIERYPGSSTLKFLKMFERFIDIPRTEKERLEAWGISNPSPDKLSTDKEMEEENVVNKCENGNRENIIAEPQSPVPTSISTSSSSTDLKRVVSPSAVAASDGADYAWPTSLDHSNHNSPGQVSSISIPKKSRLSALLSRSGSIVTSTGSISKGFHAIHSSPGSPRSPRKTMSSDSKLPEKLPSKAKNVRSSSFNESASIAAARKDASEKSSSTSSPRSRRSDSPLDKSSKNNKSLSFSPDVDVALNLSKDDSSIFLSSNSTFTSNNITADKTSPPIAVSPLPPAEASTPPTSSGWKIPSDITWPTAYDKGDDNDRNYNNRNNGYGVIATLITLTMM